MNPIANQINEILAIDILEDKNALTHYGVKRRSGRYPWGSGENPYQRSADFLARYEEYAKAGKSQKEIADEMGISTTDIRVMLSHARHERRKLEVDRAKSLQSDGYSTSEIARKMGYPNESSIRNLLNNEQANIRSRQAENTAERLAEEVKQKGYLDVGKATEHYLGVSANKLEEALLILSMDGYEVRGVQTAQTTNTKQKTTVKVLCPPGTTYADAYKALANNEIKQVGEFHSNDGGLTFQKRQYPASIDSKRIDICYGDQGGKDKDGLIEIRRGVEDLSLGNSNYAQVRILVDGTHYLKGMAIYADDLPDGIDIRFNTNKTSDVPKMKTLKGIKTDDPDNPFGAYIKAEGQSTYTGKDGKEHLSAINKLKEEGDWDKQSKNISSQFLSKQPEKLISQQLKLTYADYKDQYDTIMSLTNPTIKKALLLDMADTCEGAAVHLKASALPRQRSQVLIPVPGMKDNEVYAPNFRDGEKVVLIRYPHGGTFELPELTVNNKAKAGIDILGPTAKDAVGINSSVAEILSGADFDGDSVVVIPVNKNVHIKTSPPLSQLKNFDPKTEYKIPEDDTKTKRLSEKQKQREMGIVSNLITDMTLGGAPEDEIARAVKHSMVVIDAPKHGLDYKRSEKDNGIAELKKKWQVRIDPVTGETHYGGASTLISRRKQNIKVPETKGSGWIDKETGEVHYKESGRTYVDKKGNTVEATQSKKLILATPDVNDISSGTLVEKLYADYANDMKALANQCRRSIYTDDGKAIRLQKNSGAALIFADEVKSLNDKLKSAQMNAPIERQANMMANSRLRLAKQANPDIDKDEEKKLRQIYIEDARNSLGARSKKVTAIDISDKEWEAIQAGAISDSKLSEILKYTDTTKLKQMAMPKSSQTLSAPKQSKIRAMLASGYTNQEIADAMGISVSTVFKYASNQGKE